MSGQIFLESSELSVSEAAGKVFIAISRSGDLSQPVNVEYATTGGAASNSDYTDVAGTITIPAGETRVVVEVDINNDQLSEATEDFTMSLINVDSGNLLFPRTARIDILDDENPVVDPVNPGNQSDFDVTENVVADGLTQPIAFEFSEANPDLMYIAEKGGKIKLFDTSTGQFQADLIDLESKVNNIQDRGLLDIALHPDLENNPYLYAFYVVDPEGTEGQISNAGENGGGNRFSHIVRFELDEASGYTQIVEGSETVLLGGAGQSLTDISGNGAIDSTSNFTAPASDIDPNSGEFIQDYIKVDSRSHAGGSLEFGPDGALYISTGDGASFNAVDPRAVGVQDINSLAGKILRVDPITGEGLSDNPFATGDLSENASKVYQLGLRNPFSMSFDAEGQLIITDTGWNSWEELNAGPAGSNFGWPYYEGGDNGQIIQANGYNNLPEAIAFYAEVAAGNETIAPSFRAFSHRTNDPGFQVQAITGADDLIDSDKYPDELQDFYIFTDVSQGEVFAVNANDQRDVEFLYKTDNGFGPVHFKQGPDGYIYYANIVNGEIGRLEIERAKPGTLQAEYFAITSSTTTLSDVDFSAPPIGSEVVRKIDESTNGSFFENGLVDDFAARYTGGFDVETAGDFTFTLTSDDGAQLYIDGVLIIDNDGLHAAQSKAGAVALSAGNHTIEVRYFERGGDAVIDLDWAGPGFTRTQMLFVETEPPLNPIEGTSGNDDLDGTDADDIMLGNGGSDVFGESLGNDTIIGDANVYDQVNYSGAAADYEFTKNADGTVTVVNAISGKDTLTEIDGIWFSGEERWYDIDELLQSSSGTIEGTAGDDFLFGSVGDDVMNGNGGEDTFASSLGNDAINGNAGEYSQVNYPGSASDYLFTLNTNGSVTVSGALTGTDVLTEIDGIWFTGEENWYPISDLLESTGGPIEGTSGDDYLLGTDGADVMNGNGGEDTFLGSLGDDTINGNAAAYSQVDYFGTASDYSFVRNEDGSITVTGAQTGTDTLNDIDGIWFVGEEAWYDIDDLISNPPGSIEGSSGDDLLYGTTDSETYNGNGGSDTFVGSLGDDVINGNASDYSQVNYEGAASDYSIVRNGDGSITVSRSGFGTDTLNNIDAFWFAGEDQWYDANDLAGNAISAQNLIATPTTNTTIILGEDGVAKEVEGFQTASAVEDDITLGVDGVDDGNAIDTTLGLTDDLLI